MLNSNGACDCRPTDKNFDVVASMQFISRLWSNRDGSEEDSAIISDEFVQ